MIGRGEMAGLERKADLSLAAEGFTECTGASDGMDIVQFNGF